MIRKLQEKVNNNNTNEMTIKREKKRKETNDTVAEHL